MNKDRKLNLDELQKEFDQILNSLSRKDLVRWLENDRKKQLERLLSGKPVIVCSINNVQVAKPDSVQEPYFEGLSLAA